MAKRSFILSVAVFLLFSVAASAAENLLTNPSFEEPKGAVGENPTEWWSWNEDYNGITIDAKRTGSQAIYFTSYPEPNGHGGILYTFRDIKSGKTYAFSCYVINSAKDPLTGDAIGQISIEWRKDDQEISRNWGPSFGGELSASQWKFFEMTAVAPVDADSCNFVIQFFNKDGKGTYYADDASASER